MNNDERLFEEGVRFALDAYRGLKRKMSDLPYVIHPLETATIAAGMTDDMEIIVAAMLHDAIEDGATTDIDIAKYFSGRVLELVLSDTETPVPGKSKEESWLERKMTSLEKLRESRDIGVKIVWLADKLSNFRSIYRQYLVEGDAVWNHFHQKDPYVQVEYYRALLDALEPLKDTAAYKEYATYLEIVFRK